MVKVIPSILTNDPNEARQMLETYQSFAVKRVQIDIIDGLFADNKTIDPSVFDDVETSIKLDFHLMVKEPSNWIEKCIRAGADRIIGHIEKMADPKQFIQKVQEAGSKVGLALDLETPVGAIDEIFYKDLDVVLVMSVPAGHGGQEFRPEVVKKIRRLADLRKNDESPFAICVDGGIKKEIVSKLSRMGVDELSVGRILFKGNVSDNIKEFEMASS